MTEVKLNTVQFAQIEKALEKLATANKIDSVESVHIAMSPDNVKVAYVLNDSTRKAEIDTIIDASPDKVKDTPLSAEVQTGMMPEQEIGHQPDISEHLPAGEGMGQQMKEYNYTSEPMSDSYVQTNLEEAMKEDWSSVLNNAETANNQKTNNVNVGDSTGKKTTENPDTSETHMSSFINENWVKLAEELSAGTVVDQKINPAQAAPKEEGTFESIGGTAGGIVGGIAAPIVADAVTGGMAIPADGALAAIGAGIGSKGGASLGKKLDEAVSNLGNPGEEVKSAHAQNDWVKYAEGFFDGLADTAQNAVNGIKNWVNPQQSFTNEPPPAAAGVQQAPKQQQSARTYNDLLSPEDIKAYQTQLGVTADGIIGPETDAAIRKLQEENGIGVDGIIGPDTKAVLQSKAQGDTRGQQNNQAPAQPAAPDSQGQAQPDQNQSGGVQGWDGTIPFQPLDPGNPQAGQQINDGLAQQKLQELKDTFLNEKRNMDGSMQYTDYMEQAFNDAVAEVNNAKQQGLVSESFDPSIYMNEFLQQVQQSQPQQ